MKYPKNNNIWWYDHCTGWMGGAFESTMLLHNDIHPVPLINDETRMNGNILEIQSIYSVEEPKYQLPVFSLLKDSWKDPFYHW